MHYKDTETGKYYGYKATESCIEIEIEAIKQEIEDAKTPEEKAEEARLVLKADRDVMLNNMTHTLGDGSVVQTRPDDLTNFQIAIDKGVDKEWVLADNTIRTLTLSEMGECLASGVTQAEAIWQVYIDGIKAL